MTKKNKKVWILVSVLLVLVLFTITNFNFSILQPISTAGGACLRGCSEYSPLYVNDYNSWDTANDRYNKIYLYPNINKERLELVPKDIIFNISANKPSAMVGEDLIINLKITSKKQYNYKGILQLKYRTSAPFGIAESTDKKVVDILQGENNYLFQVKTEHFTDKLEVTPILDVYYIPTGVERDGVHGYAFGGTWCGAINNLVGFIASDAKIDGKSAKDAASCSGKVINELGGCQFSASSTYIQSSTVQGSCTGYKPSEPKVNFIPLGNAEEPTFSVMINPAPLYLTDRDCVVSGCPTNYDCKTDTKLCIRNDVKELSCVQTGCPVTVDKQYECTSAGICAEKVYIYKDCTSGLECPSGTECDTSSGACINTIIKEEIVQCVKSSDCLIPCEGVSATCSTNKCSYSGECTPTTVQCLKSTDCPPAPCAGIISSCEDTKCTYKGSCDPVYLAIDCASEGGICPDGYTCDKSINPAVCKRDIYIYQDCTSKDYKKASQNNNPNNPVCGKEDKRLNNIFVGEVNAYCPDSYTCTNSLTNDCEKLKYSCPKDYTCNYNSKLCEKSIVLDCNNLGCPQGYTCLTNYDGTGVCKTEIRKDLDCRDLGCPQGYTCNTNTFGYVCIKEGYTTPRIISNVPKTVYLASIGMGLLVYFIVIKGKRKRR